MQPIAWRIILAFAAIKFLLHLYANGSYGYFRDELYFIACGRHLDWGYVDHPPLIALYARFGEMLGPSLRAFRFFSCIVGAARLVLTGVIAARLGGNRLAQALACMAVFIAPAYLATDTILTMNAVEHLFWLGCLLIVIEIANAIDIANAIEIANGASEKWWLAFGAVAGLGLQNKHSMLFLGAAVVVALLLTPLRRSLLRPWIYLGGAIAALIFLPNVIWEIRHDFATLELLRNVKETGKNIVLAPLPFVLQQARMLNPFSAPLWIAGLLALFFDRDLRRYRVLAWIYVVVLLMFIRLEAKDYYLAPVYPMLFAAGAVWCTLRLKRAMLIPIFAVIVLTGVIIAPLVLPVLPPAKYLAYQRALGVEPDRTEVSHTSEMPQLYSDQMGWEEMTREVARIYHSLPPDQRRKTAIYGSNYGEAAAIDFYGPKYGLPPAISGHQSYYLWGPRDFTGESIIVIASRIVRTRPFYSSIVEVGKRYHPYAMPEENGPIFLVRTKRPLREIWPNYKNWR